MGEAREYLIRKDGYFYRPNSCGYTTSKFEAGRYTKADAEAEASVEPWHMSAVHQDDVPDDVPSRSIKDKDAEIAKLRRERDAARETNRRLHRRVQKWEGIETSYRMSFEGWSRVLLYGRIANAGHGHFWIGVFDEFRQALAAREGAE